MIMDASRVHSQPSNRIGGRSSTGGSMADPSKTLSKLSRLSSEEASTADSYLAELLTYSVERLNKEPELLKQEAEKLNRQLTEVSVDRYEAFLAAEHCLQDLHLTFETLQEHLTGFQTRLPSFEKACEEFEKGVVTAQGKWKEKRKLMSNKDTVLTLLEIPKLMETCVRNGNTDEALDLQAFVQRLSVHCGELSVIKSLKDSSRRVKDLILQQLTEKLRTSIQLPDCLTAVGHLRRLGLFTERELRACFLLCREDWISSLLAEADEEQPFECLKRLTDIHRLHLFDVMIQYKAVFATERNEGEEGLLATWALHRIEGYLEILRSTLPKIKDGASLVSLLENSMYCGMSLGRVGLDFRHLLIPIFEPCVLNLFKTRLDAALEVFATQLETFRWTSTAAAESTAAESNGSQDLSPPAQLREHAPIAMFVNGYLGALNELRHCAPVRGQQCVFGWVEDALNRMVNKLKECGSSRSFDLPQREAYCSACSDIKKYLGPYIVATLDAVYPDSLFSKTREALLLVLDGLPI